MHQYETRHPKCKVDRRKTSPRDLKFAALKPIFSGVPIKPQPTYLGKVLGNRADVVSRWVRLGAARQEKDPKFAEEFNELARRLREIEGE